MRDSLVVSSFFFGLGLTAPNLLILIQTGLELVYVKFYTCLTHTLVQYRTRITGAYPGHTLMQTDIGGFGLKS